MAKDYDFEIYGQPSHQDPKERKLKVYFSEPDDGINEDTGILLMIAGFGGNSNSNVYKKMRSTFSDKYNLVVVQSDYFGWEFMQGAENFTLHADKLQLEKYFNKEEIRYIYKDNSIFERLMEIASKNKIDLTASEMLAESLDNYNDMGLIQAIDNISAVISVMEIIKDNGYKFNKDKVILYGHSHGAYLSYLCNALAPNLFSLLIDNSSWLIPGYLEANRSIGYSYGNSVLMIEFEYMAKQLNFDREILYLPSLYKKFDNRCKIICYHGTDDCLISNEEKVRLKEVIKDFNYNEIAGKDVDNIVFKSTQHGLDADFLKLYDYTMERHKFKDCSGVSRENKNITYKTNANIYLIDYSKTVPVLYIDRR